MEKKIKKFINDITYIIDNSRLPKYGIEITTTDKCNFKCSYCFENTEKCSENILSNNIDRLYKQIDSLLISPWAKRVFSGIKIGFWGGEPTINSNLIYDVINKYKNNNNVFFHLYTNGTNIDCIKNIYDMIMDKHRLSVQISYDGGLIHEKNRKTKTGFNTNKLIINNAQELYNSGIPFGFKSTIPIEDFINIPTAWDDFNELYKRFPKNNIRYAATIDYHNNLSLDYLKPLENSLIELIKKELIFYKKNGHHLMNWFSTIKRDIHCSAGRLFSSVGTDGNHYICHGCQYSKNKNDFIFGNINNNNFPDLVRKNYELFKEEKDINIDKCIGCEAVICLKCNVKKYEDSENSNFLDKWYDYTNQNILCSYYKKIGLYNRALQLKKREI